MKLFDRLDRNIDFNNYYTIKKAIGIMENEFNLAVRNNDKLRAEEVLHTAKKIYEKLASTYRESSDYGETMSYIQKVWAKRLRFFINYLEKEINKKPVNQRIVDLVNANQ